MKVNKLVARNEQDLRDCLDLIYQKAKEGKHFYGLFELIKNKEVILTAIHNIKSNKGSKTAGIDKKIVDDYLQMPLEKVLDMVNRKLDNYRPIPVRRHYIPKGDTKNIKQSQQPND